MAAIRRIFRTWSGTMKSLPHYPFATQMLIALFSEGLLPDVRTVEVEPEYGFAARIVYRNGAVRITKGSDIGLNRGAASDVAKDKHYTKIFLQGGGFRCPTGSAFLLPWWVARIAPKLISRGFATLNDSSAAAKYASDVLGFPVYVKPVDGSKGSGVWRCETIKEVEEVLDQYETARIRVAIVEEAVPFPDCRLVVLDGTLISAYRRYPIAVHGDGRKTIAELIVDLQAQFDSVGRDTRIDIDDPRIAVRLRRNGMTINHVPSERQSVQLLDASNLSAGGIAEDVTDTISQRWTRLAADAAEYMGLALCGVDIACADPLSDEGEYYILEVNGTPGLDHYCGIGDQQREIVRKLYISVFNLAQN